MVFYPPHVAEPAASSGSHPPLASLPPRTSAIATPTVTSQETSHSGHPLSSAPQSSLMATSTLPETERPSRALPVSGSEAASSASAMAMAQAMAGLGTSSTDSPMAHESPQSRITSATKRSSSLDKKGGAKERRVLPTRQRKVSSRLAGTELDEQLAGLAETSGEWSSCV